MGGKTGSSTTQIIQPTPPPQPSTADAIQEYVQSLPAIFQAQLDFAPKEAQQQFDLAQEFSLPLAELARNAQNALYPETAQLQEQLAAEASAGIENGVSDDVKNQYLDAYRANLGTNAGSPIGAQGTAQGLVQLDEDFKRYYRDLALSVSGRQPLAQPAPPGFTNQLQNFGANDALAFQSQNYNTFANNSRPIVSQNSTSRRTFSQGFGDVAGGLSGFFG